MKPTPMVSPSLDPQMLDVPLHIPFLTRPQLLIRYAPLPVGRDIATFYLCS
jgi:hypothetical protein